MNTAGPGDFYGAYCGHPHDPRTECDAYSNEWFAIDESERLIRQMKDALDDGDVTRFLDLRADLVRMNTEPMQ